MIEIVKAVEVHVIGGFRLRVHFSDRSFGDHDFSDMVVEPGPMVEPLRDPKFFARVFIEMGVLAWPNGLDIDSIQLHREMGEAGELRRPAA